MWRGRNCHDFAILMLPQYQHAMGVRKANRFA